MEDAFGTLIWVVAGGGAIVGLITLVLTGRTYSQIGGGGVVHDDEADAARPESAAQREEEIRQLLQARNARRVRRGEAPQDVEAQLAALQRPPPVVDDELRHEIREHVIVRNARRVRAGEQPLDVEQEVQRRISELA
ncbi:MAG: hypothetical protein ACR2LK_13330 [Solirubrobacteraceae bacterium]